MRHLDIGAGAGNTSSAIYNQLSPAVRKRTVFYLVEPARASLDNAIGTLKTHGIRYQAINKTDIDCFKDLEGNSFHVITSVAAIHHHAY